MGVWLLDAYGPARDGRAVAFVLFIATALSVTALPVLARILSDLGLERTPVGLAGTSAAVVCDVFAWAMLAVTLSIDSTAGAWGSILRLLVSAVFTLLMLMLGPRLLRLLLDGRGRPLPGPAAAGVLCAGVLLSAWTTSLLGLHSIYGAFVFGLACLPLRNRPVVCQARAQLAPVAALFAPLYFIVVGLGVELPTTVGGVGLVLGLVAVAFGSKALAAGGAGLLHGFGRAESALFAVLMNTRGITEIVVLSAGHSIGLIGPELFSVLTIVALVSTAVTGPVLRQWCGWLAGPVPVPGANEVSTAGAEQEGGRQ